MISPSDLKQLTDYERGLRDAAQYWDGVTVSTEQLDNLFQALIDLRKENDRLQIAAGEKIA